MENIYQFKIFSNFKDIIHFVSKRDISKPLENSLALHTGEKSSLILENRIDISKSIVGDMDFVLANQTHSSNIEIIRERRARGWRDKNSAVKNCDALITKVKGVMVGVLTADCVPILIFDPKLKIVGAIHAGWRGTKEKIALKTLKRMVEEFNSNPKDIVVGVAPSIRGCCYEVDFNVAQHFLEYKGLYKLLDNGKYIVDLPNINIRQLLSLGVERENIEDSNICTYCEFNNYFSYRKTACSGRFLSTIGIK